MALFKNNEILKPDDIRFLPKQQEVINLWAEGNDKIFFEGSIRAGKSLTFAYIIDFICSHTIGMEFYVYRDTFESIKKDTHRIFLDHPGFANGKAKLKELGKRLYYPSTQSNIFFQHTKGGKHTLGQTAGGIFFEQLESMAEEDFDLIVPRLSQWGPKAIADYCHKYEKLIKLGKIMIPRNYLFMSSNPRAGWLKARYIDTKNNLEKEHIQRVSTSVYDNLANLGPEYANLVNTSSSAFKKQYFDGDWTLNSGLIYPEFNPLDVEDGGNVVTNEWEKSNKIDYKMLKHIISIDPGFVKSKFAALMVVILKDGRILCVDEVVKNGKGVESWDKIGPEQFSKELLEKYKERDFLATDQTLIDPAAHNPNGGMGSISGQLTKNGIVTMSAKKTDEYGSILGIKDAFKNKQILVNARCQFLIRELGLFRWDERKVLKGEQKPLDEDNDQADNLRYIYAITPQAKKFPLTWEDQMKKNYNPNNQYSGWMEQWKKKPKKNAIGWNPFL